MTTAQNTNVEFIASFEESTFVATSKDDIGEYTRVVLDGDVTYAYAGDLSDIDLINGVEHYEIETDCGRRWTPSSELITGAGRVFRTYD